MPDKLTKEQRHRCMSRIRGRDTKPEMLVRRFLFGKGYRYRVNDKRLPGSPDIVLRKYRTVIFVNGCFWHAHEGCRYYVVPKTNTEFWEKKFARNRERDQQDYEQLHRQGWNVVVLWECQLKPAQREFTLGCLDYILNKVFLENLSGTEKKTFQITVHDRSLEETSNQVVVQQDSEEKNQKAVPEIHEASGETNEK